MTGNERGQTTVLTLGLALLVFAIAGLAVDGTRAFLFRRTLQNAADSASLAGAAEIDSGSYYRSGGRTITVEPERARSVALDYLARRGIEARVGLDVTSDGVVVVLRGEISTTFLGLVGIGRVPVAVEARAEPLAGSP